MLREVATAWVPWSRTTSTGFPCRPLRAVDKIGDSAPGHIVQPDWRSFAIEQPRMQRDVLRREFQLKAAEANYANPQVQIDSELNEQKATKRRCVATTSKPHCRHDVDEIIFKQGITRRMSLASFSKVKEDQLAIAFQLEGSHQDFARFRQIPSPSLAGQVDQQKALYRPSPQPA